MSSASVAERGAAAVVHPRAAGLTIEPQLGERRVGWIFVGTGVAVFGVMGLAGLTMRFAQGRAFDIPAAWFYRLMTVHGAGMLTGALLAMTGALWMVLRPTVPLRVARMAWSYALILAGAVCVIAAVLGGGFGAGWTFLMPLPFLSAGQWGAWATALFMVGLALVGVGFMVFCVDVLQQTTAAYGGLPRTLGLHFLRGRDDAPPPPHAIAAVVVAIDGLLASAVGTTIVLAELGKTYDSGARLDALWAKNLTYFFGHSIANLIIYLAAGVIYVLVPRYAGRPWKTTKPIVVGWLATLVFVATAYSHHLYMDFVQPQIAQYVSETVSFAAALPVAVVTIYTGIMLIWGSRYRWTLASTLLYLGFLGWLVGGAGAVIDSIIPINFRFHNTLWVAAHFHTYLLMCVIFWMLAIFAHLLEGAAGRTAPRGPAFAAVGLMLVGGYGLVGTWFLSGALGLPRRYAVQPAGTSGYSLAGAIFAAIFAVGFLVLLSQFVALGREALERRRTVPAQGVRTVEGASRPAPERPQPGAPDAAALGTPTQLALALAAAVVGLASFLPPVTDAAEASTQYHHLQHAAQFLCGALLGLVLACVPAVAERLGARFQGLGLAVVVAAPAAMLLVMVPSVYEPIDSHPALHALYHIGIGALGFLTGLGAARLGRTAGRLAIVLSVGMGLMFAAGVTGG